MRNIWTVFKTDLRTLSKCFFACVVVVAIALLPSLYAWLNIYSNWDPYGNTGGISIAVASLDRGYTDNGEYVNKGRDVLEDLKTATSINWVIVDTEQEATDGVYAGDYYAAVVIDEDFSRKMYRMFTDWTGQPAITYYENAKKNAVATKITDTAVETLKRSISENYLEVVISGIMEQSNLLAADLTETDPETAVKGLLYQAQDVLSGCRAMMDAFRAAGSTGVSETDAQALSDAIASINSSLPDGDAIAASAAQLQHALYTALANVERALDRFESALDTAQPPAAQQQLRDAAAAMGKLSTQLSGLAGQLDGINVTGNPVLTAQAIQLRELAGHCTQLQNALNQLADGGAAGGSTVTLIDSGLDAADDTSDGLLGVLDAADAILADLEQLLRDADMTPVDDAVHARIDALIDRALEKLETARSMTDDEVLIALLDDAIAGLESLRTAVDQTGISQVQGPLLDMVLQVRQSLRTAAVNTNRQVSDYLHDAGTRAQSTLYSVQQLLDAASGSLGGVSGTLAAYADAVAAAQPTLASGITLAQSVSGYLADMEEDVRRVTDSAAFRRFIELMESDSDSMADYLASPVQMNTEIIYEIKDYGAAMSPYYVMLALFVGSLLTAVMVKVPVTQPEFLNCRGIERYFGRFLTFFCMAMAQALVTAFGCLWFVGMETAEPALFVLACCLCSLNFAAMNYALVYSLDNVGLAASVIIMVLQVAGSGGSYPIDVLPALFRRLYPFMPFHYGMDMLRETIGGLYGHTYLRCALILLGMCVLFTAFGLLVYYPARRLNAAIAASKEKSGIM